VIPGRNFLLDRDSPDEAQQGNGTLILNRLEGRDSKNGRQSALERYRHTIRNPADSTGPFLGPSRTRQAAPGKGSDAATA
jgi:hypothetical protein